MASQSANTTGLIIYSLSPSGYAAGTQPMRWEARIHGFGSDIPNAEYGVLQLGSMGITSGGSNLLYFGLLGNGGFDTAANMDTSVPCCLGATGTNGDVILRSQRDPAGVNCGGMACYTFEICYTLGGHCAYATYPLTAVVPTWTGGAVFRLQPGIDVAFVRWFPTIVAAGLNGAGLVNPISVVPPSNPSSLMGDWEFEAGMNDSSGNAGAWIGPATFSITPTYPPSCSAGSQQSARAGSTITLGGSGQPLDGGSTLSPLWQQVAGVSPTPVVWTTSQRFYDSTAVLPQFGPYDFQLTVTDGSGQSTSCTVHDGAAPTDNTGVVLYPPGPLYSAANQLLGPLIQWGRNPWPWYDTTHKLAADINLAALGPPVGNGLQEDTLSAAIGATDSSLPVANCNGWNGANTGAAVIVDSEQVLLGACTDSTHAAIWQRGYRGTTAASHASGAAVNEFWYWDWYDYNTGPGTITVTAGSTTVTGVGTQFKTGGSLALCDSSGVPLPNLYMVIWHPTDGSRTGRLAISVASCASDTSLTLAETWNGHVPAGSGLTYSLSTSAEGYYYSTQGTPLSINYYDNIAGYYLLWLRSGVDTYLNAARQLADTVYFSPVFDQGYAGVLGGPNHGFAGWANHMLGLWLRSLDSPTVSMVNGLHRQSCIDMYMTNNRSGYHYMSDVRPQGLELADVAYTAALDTDVTTYDLSSIGCLPSGYSADTYAQGAAATIAGAVNPSGLWNWAWYGDQTTSGSWPVWSYEETSVNQGGSVQLTNGSTAVVLSGVTWNCSGIVGDTIWFWHGPTNAFPASNSAGDSATYSLAGCTDSTHFTLNTAYTGANCAACGWLYTGNNNDYFLGLGDWGYMMGIGDRAMHYAASAISNDATNSAYARTLAVNANSWMLTHGLQPATNGINYGSDFANCPYPVAQNNLTCSKADSVSRSLGFSAEGAGAWMSTYQFNRDPATKAAMDAMYNQMWAKPGTCPAGSTICNSSVTSSCALPPCYMTQLDLSVDGYMIQPSGGSPAPPKWFGQYFGFGDYSSWPAIRLGGAAAEASQAAYIDFDLKAVEGATKVRVEVTLPNGDSTETECRSSPCVIGVDPRQGTYRLKIAYLSSDSKVLSIASSQRSIGF